MIASQSQHFNRRSNRPPNPKNNNLCSGIDEEVTSNKILELSKHKRTITLYEDIGASANTTNVSVMTSSTPTADTDMTVHIQGLIQTTSAGDFVIQLEGNRCRYKLGE